MKNKKTVLITGAALRIGRAIALALAQEGYHIALHCHHSVREANQLAKIIKRKKVSSEVFVADLNDRDDVQSLIKDVKKKMPGLNVLINNASIFEKSNLKNWTWEHYHRHWNINFTAPFVLISEFAKAVKEGQVVNILDTNIVKDHSQHLIYLLTKKSLSELTKLAASELAPKIRVNAVAPGPILPPSGLGQKYLKQRAAEVPLRKIGSPQQIADCVLFLLKSEYVTGQIIFNDGGAHLADSV